MNNYEKKFKKFLNEGMDIEKQEEVNNVDETSDIQEAQGDSPTDAVYEYIANTEPAYREFFIDFEDRVANMINDMKQDGTAEDMLNYTDDYTDVDSFLSDVNWESVFLRINDME